MGKSAKSRITYNYEPGITLNEEQLRAKEIINNNKLTILTGRAGSGKSLLAVEAALNLLSKKELGYEKIIITRPYVTTEEYGLLPGTLSDKVAPNYEVIKNLFYEVIKKDKVDAMISDGDIEILSVGFCRGATFKKAIIINDEAQNFTAKQTLLLLTRLGKGSKMIFTLDADQIDIKPNQSCVAFLRTLTQTEGVGSFELKQNHRDPLVRLVIEKYAEYIKQDSK